MGAVAALRPHVRACGDPPLQPCESCALPCTPSAGRRKSTPAALDMALRTAEGKAAIEELINSAGKKQMVFGQYFGGSGNASQV